MNKVYTPTPTDKYTWVETTHLMPKEYKELYKYFEAHTKGCKLANQKNVDFLKEENELFTLCKCTEPVFYDRR
jgi:hypothetical protein